MNSSDIFNLKFGEVIRSLLGDGFWVEILIDVLGVIVVASFCLVIVIWLIWAERKVIARMQDRIGPNRVGRYGFFQSFADIAKLLTKEQITPAGADRLAYNVAPPLIVMTAVLMWAVIPFAPNLVGVDLNIGVFYILAISSASVVSVLLAGWGSNNKYALLGAFRSVAQLVSYEVPMVIALLVPILLSRTMSTVGIIEAQTLPYWLVIPISAIIFFISALAETGRTPFDLLEAESEIIAGFHVEYSGMKFAMFQLAEFVGALFMSAMFVVIYMGGWNLPLVNAILGMFNFEIPVASVPILGLLVFFLKLFSIYFVFIWIRATLPRVRVDQILDFNWKFLVPLSLVMLLVVAILDRLIPASVGPIGRGLIHLISHLIIGFVTLEIIRRRGRANRIAYETAHGIISEETMSNDDHHGHGHDDHGHDHHDDHGHDAHGHTEVAHAH